MPEHTPSAWIKPIGWGAAPYWKAWADYANGKTSISYGDHYRAATQANPFKPSMDLMEGFSMHIAKLRLKRQL